MPQKPYKTRKSVYMPQKPYKTRKSVYMPQKPYKTRKSVYMPQKPYKTRKSVYMPQKPYKTRKSVYMPQKPYTTFANLSKVALYILLVTLFLALYGKQSMRLSYYAKHSYIVQASKTPDNDSSCFTQGYRLSYTILMSGDRTHITQGNTVVAGDQRIHRINIMFISLHVN